MKQIIKQATTPTNWQTWETNNATNLTTAISTGSSGGQIWSMGKQNWGFNADNVFKEILVKEQYFICCYCNCRIAINSETSFEHYSPKSSFTTEIFKYNNLYAACNCGKSDATYSPRQIHCDAEGAKGDKDPTVINIIEPNNRSCETAFEYDINGNITGKTPEATNTIRELKLNCPRLVIQRERAINDYLEINTDSVATDVLQPYPDIDGCEKLQPFCIAIAQNL
jgi:uncharacterized protein (TIGR02646 family)